MSWVCPHCGTTATLQGADVVKKMNSGVIATAPDEDGIVVSWTAIRCPSNSCGKYVLDVRARFGEADHYANGERSSTATADNKRPVGIGDVRFEPRVAKPLSLHAPASVKEDYEEASLIKDLSPKAAATLCRRALQGMIRHHWGVAKERLADELKAIKEMCDPDLYRAMMALKGVGNIGAHPERDINLIVDVEPGEVETLMELLQILDREWFVARARRAESLAAVVALATTKADVQRGSTGAV